MIKYDINSPEFVQAMHQYFSTHYIQSVHAGDVLPCGDTATSSSDCADCSRKGYRNHTTSNNVNVVDYSCNQKTLIYALRSMPCHAEEIRWALSAGDSSDNSIYQPID